jgi:hypothetical protein
MGWAEVVRFWLPAWVRDRAEFLANIEAAVARAEAADKQAAPTPPDDAEDAPTTVAAQAQDVPDSLPTRRGPAATVMTAEPEAGMVKSVARTRGGRTAGSAPPSLSGRIPFQPFTPTLIGTQSDLGMIGSDAGVQAAVRGALRAVIVAEGPVEQHRLARLTLAQFGFAKTSQDRRASVLGLVDQWKVREHSVGTFVWPTDISPDTWLVFRSTQAASHRDFHEIAPEEIANALCYALAATPRITEDELLRSAMDHLGYKRKTEKIDKLLRYGMQVARDNGRLVRGDDGRYRLSVTSPPVILALKGSYSCPVRQDLRNHLPGDTVALTSSPIRLARGRSWLAEAAGRAGRLLG